VSKLRHPQPGTEHTFGIAMRPDGEPIWRDSGGDPNLMSGTQGPGKGGPGLRTDHPFISWHLMQTARQHVEGHTAALMRRPGGPAHVTLLVTQEPCEDWPNGCDRVLDAIIPLGSRLDVYVVDSPGAQPRYWDTYHGNGEGVAR
jgi:hypothetical protein